MTRRLVDKIGAGGATNQPVKTVDLTGSSFESRCVVTRLSKYVLEFHWSSTVNILAFHSHITTM